MKKEAKEAKEAKEIKYKARGTFHTGKTGAFVRGKIYDKIPEGWEGHFEKV